MTERETTLDQLELTVEGIGGIDSTAVTLHEGVNVLEGRNATNRTSLLQAIIGALGGDAVSLKGDRDTGHVELTLDGTSYTRELNRDDGQVRFDGDPYLSDATEAELFAFLVETNEARRAVATGADLRDIIMRPVDTDEIDRQIRELQSERSDIDNRITSLERQRENLPDLEERKTQLDTQLQEAREARESISAELEAAEDDEQEDEPDQLEPTLEQLNEARSEQSDIEYRLQTEREARASSREELAEKKTEREELPDVSEQQVTELADRISELRRRKRTLDTRVSKLHRIVQFNEEMLEADSTLRRLLESDGEREVTEELSGNTETTCWTCGSPVDGAEIEDMLDRLRELSQSQRQDRNELEQELEELTDRRDELEAALDRRETLSDRIASLQSDIDRRERRIEELETKHAETEDRIEELETRATTLEDQSSSDVAALRQELNEQTLTVERLERERDEVVEEIAELEAKADEIEELKRKREQISDQLSELRTRIDRLEADAVEAFNDHIAELVDLLEYENLARVWIERKRSGSDREETTFDLHIVRTTGDGVTYEDTADHLSESEREIVGIVFALAGYLVHEVYETVPVMLLDSLEAIDSERIALLVEYLAEYSPTIVAALLPEDADALPDEYPRITDI